MKNEIIKSLKTFGELATTELTYAFGSGFEPAIKALHKEGKVIKTKKGWKAA